MSDADMMALMGISGFGAKKSKVQLDRNRFDKNKRPFQAPVQPASSSSSAGPSSNIPVAEPVYDPDDPSLAGRPDADDENEDEYDEDDAPQFPITHELVLADHTKVVSALAVDPSGARVLSGSHDYDCKLWDFGGMDVRCKPFKSWEPAGSYYVNDLKYSNKGDQFLVISGTSQAKLYDRDGEEKATFIKGDMYIRDMKHTAGHVADLTSCAWHPYEENLFITSSADSTIRIWDVENKRKQKTVIVVKSKERGARTKVMSCAYSPDGSIIAGACLDGALHLWNANSNFVRPNHSIEGAHQKNSETGSIVFSRDGWTMLTRASDDTVKLWDLRKFRKPIAEKSGLATLYPGTNAVFSPDEKYVVTGSSAPGKGKQGSLLLLDRETLEKVESVEMPSSVVKVLWHTRINQVLVGLASGQITVLYSPLTSSNGAKLLLNKGPPRKATIESLSNSVMAPAIITPHALPMFRDGDDIVAAIGSATKRKREKERNDPRKSHKPELPVTGPGKGGRVGASATQHIVQNLFRDTTRDMDVSVLPDFSAVIHCKFLLSAIVASVLNPQLGLEHLCAFCSPTAVRLENRAAASKLMHKCFSASALIAAVSGMT
ncbi:WD40 repeat-like protein [Sistotremastrum suecicum HHB10207 ss-3]|uniref:WD40 repeat-like protein n=1 Tax=Sistotremastrum suecicum HHB10207 ss-3 TaxID=1314776 RepID=A0A166BPS4_9AGAM|nr:WD40 repeat-like protein [Sistotremastrum suecicum HHB10207 ss-3]